MTVTTTTASASVTIVIAQEPLLLQAWLERARASLAVGALDEQIFRGPEASAAEVIAAAQSVPLAAARRLVVVQEAQTLPAPALEALTRYAQRPSPASTLLLLVRGELPRAAGWSSLLQAAEVAQCASPEGQDLARWLQQETQRQGKQLSTQASAILEEQWGQNLLALGHAVAQAACYVGERATIEAADVEALGGRNPQATAFQWADCIVARSGAAALQFLGAQARDPKAGPQLIGLLAWQFERLLRAKRLQAGGASEPQVLGAAGIKPYWRQAFLRQLAGYTLSQLQQALTTIAETDAALKRGRVDQETGLTVLVTRLCSLAAAR